MAVKLARFDDDLVSWYENAAKHENAIRLKKGLKPIKWIDLLRVVVARYAGLPVAHELDLDGIQRRAKRTAKQAPASDMTTPPHGGRSKKAPAKRKSKKAPAKKTSTSEMWTPPHGG